MFEEEKVYYCPEKDEVIFIDEYDRFTGFVTIYNDLLERDFTDNLDDFEIRKIKRKLKFIGVL